MSKTSEDNGDDVGLLDLLVIIAERWLIVVIVPLVAGIAAYFFVASQPQLWRAQAIVGLPDTVVTAGLANFNGDATVSGHATAAEITAGLAVLPTSLPARSTIELTLSDRTAVSATLTAMVESLERKANSGEIAFSSEILSDLIAATSAEVDLRTQVIESLKQQLATLRDNPAEDGTVLPQIAATLNNVLLSREVQVGQLTTLEDRLAELPKKIVEMPPSEPVQIAVSSPVRFAIIAAIGALFFVMVVVLVQIGFTIVAADTRARPKIDRIRRAFWLKPIGSEQ